MFGLNVKIEDTTKAVEQAVEKATYRNLGHAAASLRKDVIGTIKTAPKEARRRAKRRKGKVVRRARHAASPPGTPPYTQRGQLRRAIVYDVQKDSAIVGPRFSVVGESGAVHEFGGAYKGQSYPERPYMFPGLERIAPRFGASFAGSIGE